MRPGPRCMAHARHARAEHAARRIEIRRRWAVVFLPTPPACGGASAHLRARLTAALSALDRAFSGLQNGIGVGGYGDKILGGFEGGRRRASGVGERRGEERSCARRERRTLWSCVVLCQARGGVYIGSRRGRRGMAGMATTSRCTAGTGVSGTAAASGGSSLVGDDA
jgi:hypothetical protein